MSSYAPTPVNFGMQLEGEFGEEKRSIFAKKV
jgi:hypothetical protein